MNKDFGILIALVLVLLVVWIGSSGTGGNRRATNDSVSRGISTDDRIAALGDPYPKSVYSPPSPPTPSQTTYTKEQDVRRLENEIKQAELEVAKIEAELKNIEKYGEPSPYKGKVFLDSGNPRTTDASREYVTLRAAATKSNPGITITGWRLASAMTNRAITIPEASYLPYTGQVNNELPIVLLPNDRAFIATGRSPIGVSFRTNLCTGYYTQFQQFNPSLRRDCPDPEDEILFYTTDLNIFLDNACMDFVERIPRCTVQTKPLPPTISPTCQDAIYDNISYNSCIVHHKNDANFRGNEWHIYLKREAPLWRDKRELIKLLDENGKTVDVLTY